MARERSIHWGRPGLPALRQKDAARRFGGATGKAHVADVPVRRLWPVGKVSQRRALRVRWLAASFIAACADEHAEPACAS
jgi:hypothetical protein